MSEIIIVSACLLGINTRYDGKDAFCQAVIDELKGKTIIPVCPEQLGGLSTPRPRSEIIGGEGKDVLEGRANVKVEFGGDVSDKFTKGAKEVLKIAKLTGATKAFLKEKSPSCGVDTIRRGKECVHGSGVTAALLKKEGFELKGF